MGEGRASVPRSSMRLYLLRHAEASPLKIGEYDRDRALTAEGGALMRRLGHAITAAGWKPGLIISSPYLRARQTARLVAEALQVTPETDALLIPGFSLQDLEEVVSRQTVTDQVMIVAHQPSLGQVVMALTGASVAFHPGTLAVIETQRLRHRNGVLYGLYQPDVLAGLGGI